MSSRNLKLWILFAFMLLCLAACSRPPRVTQPQVQINADATLKLAQSLEQKQHLRDSQKAYLSARNQYRSFGDITGQCFTISGLARIAYQQGNSAEYDSLRKDLEYLVYNAEPQLSYLLTFLDIIAAKDQQDYGLILALAKDQYDYPLDVRIQILSHYLQAESYLNPGFESSNYAHLKRLSERYRGVLKRSFSAHSSVLSTAEYAMAYHSYLLDNFKAALKHIDKAIDLDYRYEVLDGLATAYWLKGSILEKLDEPQPALSSYLRARDIFADTADNRMLKEVETNIQRLQGEKP